jgi:hypothetical protein
VEALRLLNLLEKEEQLKVLDYIASLAADHESDINR